MKRKLLLVLAMVLAVSLCALALSACGHEHTLGTWQSDESTHWQQCEECGEKLAVSAHAWNNGEVTQQATCTEEGTKTFTCAVCNATKTEIIPMLAHTVEEWQTSETSHWHVCTTCNNTVDETSHTWSNGFAVKQPTCTEEGETVFLCTACGISKTEPVSALGHTESDWIVDSQPTCTQDGNKHVECTTCQQVLKVESIVATGHTPVTDSAVEPTCTQSGLTEGSHCSVCNAVLVAQQVIPANGHSWNTGEVTTEPTCTTEGTKTFTCTVCNDTRTEPVSALGHTPSEWIVDVAATCTTDGSKHVECTVCQQVLKVESISATGHTPVTDNAVAPTCTESGLTEGSHCSVCNTVLVAQQVIPANGHSWNSGEVTTEPTCTTEGTKTFTCTICNDTRTESILALGHTLSAEWNTNETSHWHVCSVCNSNVSVAEHQWSKPIVLQQPTCTEEGSQVSLCVICGETKTESIAATGHTQSGWIVDSQPTCTKFGSKHIECVVCYQVLRTSSISALGHTPVTDSAVAPTCTQSGLTEGSHCSVCNAVLVAQRTVSATGHSWNSGEVTTEPTCTTTGEKTFVCMICNATKTQTVSANGHSWNAGEVTTEPTCTTEGSKTFTCTVCNDTRTEPVSALGHTESEWIIDTQPTCTANGSKHIECTVCSEVLQVVQIAALGHTLSAEWSVGETSHWRICTVCNAKLNEASHSGTTANCDVCGAPRPATEGIVYQEVDGFAEVIALGTATDTDIVVASTYQGLPVTVIQKEAFKDCRNITSVVIPESVTTISIYAFYNCSLASVVIPESVTSIGNYAFAKSGLNSIVIPDSVTSLGEDAFYNSSLKSVTIGNGITTIGTYTFNQCYNLTSVEIPNSVTSIGYYAFEDCISLTSIVIPESVTSIGAGAFIHCSRLASIIIPDSVMTIASAAFSDCSSLTNVVIPESIISIGGGSFDNCSQLHFNQYDNALYLGNADNPYVFLYKTIATSIRSCEIHPCTKLIANRAFYNCSSLASLAIPDSVTYVDNNAFTGCSALQFNQYDNALYLGNDENPFVVLIKIEDTSITSYTIPSSTKCIYASAFSGCRNLTSVVIPDSVKTIGQEAFSSCSSLANLVIPNSVTSIGYLAFGYCSGLESIVVEEGNTVYHSSGNCLIETASKTLVRGCNNSVIPSDGSVTSIAANAFSSCRGLTSIVLPNSVTSIDAEAFSYCSGLTSIVISKSVTKIGYRPFYNCSNLTDIYCEATSKPSGWYSDWISGCSATVHWGYKG